MRRIRSTPFARPGIKSERRLAIATAREWPPLLAKARAILEAELALTPEEAAKIVVDSAGAAADCAQRIRRRAVDATTAKQRNQFCKVIDRIGRCIRRARAPLHRELVVRFTMRDGKAFNEPIELLDALLTAFAAHPSDPASSTVLRTIVPRDPRFAKHSSISDNELSQAWLDASGILRSTYFSLGPADRKTVGLILKTVRLVLEQQRSRSDNYDAAIVCQSIAQGLDGGIDASEEEGIQDLIVDYTLRIANLWLDNEVKPSRAFHPEKPKHRSKFHRFADLVLTNYVEPWARRHEPERPEDQKLRQRAWSKLPPDLRKISGASRRRADVEMLVSDDHVKAALSATEKRRKKLHKQQSRT
jgi:hypothetical protein